MEIAGMLTPLRLDAFTWGSRSRNIPDFYGEQKVMTICSSMKPRQRNDEKALPPVAGILIISSKEKMRFSET
jgi:hypothetical protein